MPCCSGSGENIGLAKTSFIAKTAPQTHILAAPRQGKRLIGTHIARPKMRSTRLPVLHMSLALREDDMIVRSGPLIIFLVHD